MKIGWKKRGTPCREKGISFCLEIWQMKGSFLKWLYGL